jgi:hypothetical protein
MPASSSTRVRATISGIADMRAYTITSYSPGIRLLMKMQFSVGVCVTRTSFISVA